MKRITVILSLIFALAIALSVSIPTMAAPNADTVVSGTVAATITVTVDDATLSFPGDIIPGGSAQTIGCTVTIQANQNWKLAVKASNGGLMWTPTSHTYSLADPMTFTGGILTDQDLTGVDQTFQTGTKATDGGFAVSFEQLAGYEDEAGNYEITITFTGSAN